MCAYFRIFTLIYAYLRLFTRNRKNIPGQADWEGPGTGDGVVGKAEVVAGGLGGDFKFEI